MDASSTESASTTGHARDRRRRRRREFSRPLAVRDAESGILIGEAANMTSSGMMMYMDVPLQRRSRLSVLVELGALSDDRANIKLDVQCRWSHRQVGGRVYETGFRFIKMSFRQKLLLEQFVNGDTAEFAEFSEI